MKLPVRCQQEVDTGQGHADQLEVLKSLVLDVHRDEGKHCQRHIQEEHKRHELVPDEVVSGDVPHVADYLHHVLIFEHFQVVRLDQLTKELH